MSKKSTAPTAARSVTLSDVARLAGVSLPTASRVLNGGVRGSGSGSPEMRERVREAAERLGYVVNAAAQATAAGASRALTLIVSDLDDFGAVTMISGVMHAAEARGLSVSVRATRDDAAREVQIVSALRGERHRGVIFAASRSSDFARESAMARALQALEDVGTRVVVIGKSELPFDAVVVDNRAAAERFARSLCSGVDGRILIVAGPEDQVTSRDRVAGFRDGAATAGVRIDEADVMRVPFSRDGGFQAAALIAERVDELGLVAAMSDALAVGVIAGLREHGIEPLGRLAVSGFDDVPMISDLLPGFSTVRVPLEQFGEAAVALLVDETGERDGSRARLVELEAVPVVRPRA